MVLQVFDILFSPLRQFGSLWTIVTISLFVSLVFSLINRIMVDPKEMKQIKEKLKQLQEMTKEARKEGKDKKIKELFEKSMENNQRMMKLQMKPLLVSMLFVILILPWLGATYGDTEISLKENTGSFEHEGQQVQVIYEGEKVSFGEPINSSVSVGEMITLDGKESIVQYNEEDNRIILENVRFQLPIAIPLLASDAVVGWLGLYILVSIASTLLFRKLLGVD